MFIFIRYRRALYATRYPLALTSRTANCKRDAVGAFLSWDNAGSSKSRLQSQGIKIW